MIYLAVNPLQIEGFLQMIASMLGKKRNFVSVPMGFGVFLAKTLKFLLSIRLTILRRYSGWVKIAPAP